MSHATRIPPSLQFVFSNPHLFDDHDDPVPNTIIVTTAKSQGETKAFEGVVQGESSRDYQEQQQQPPEPLQHQESLEGTGGIISHVHCHDECTAAVSTDESSTKENNMNELSPQEYFDALLESRGYPTQRYPTLTTAYFNRPTLLQLHSYDKYLKSCVRRNDAVVLEDCLAGGLSPNPSNMYGESLLHNICRLGNGALLDLAFRYGASVQVCDDLGRTPLHDACWAADPTLDVFEMIIDRDPQLLHLSDARGNVPLQYVRRDHWSVWKDYLDHIKDRYWPDRRHQLHCDNQSNPTNNPDHGNLSIPQHNVVVARGSGVVSDGPHDGDDHQQVVVSSPGVSLLQHAPHTRPIPDPLHALSVDLARLVASGLVEPTEAQLFNVLDQLDDDDDDHVGDVERSIPVGEDNANVVVGAHQESEGCSSEDDESDSSDDDDDDDNFDETDSSADTCLTEIEKILEHLPAMGVVH